MELHYYSRINIYIVFILTLSTNGLTETRSRFSCMVFIAEISWTGGLVNFSRIYWSVDTSCVSSIYNWYYYGVSQTYSFFYLKHYSFSISYYNLSFYCKFKKKTNWLHFLKIEVLKVCINYTFWIFILNRTKYLGTNLAQQRHKDWIRCFGNIYMIYCIF